LIYLDEPTLGVDVQSRRAIWDYILALGQQGKTVLITTNYLEEAQVLCGRIAIIDRGRLVALDTPAALKQRFGGSVVEIETVQRFQDLETLRRMPGIQEVEQADFTLKITTLSGEKIIPQILNMVAQCCEIRDIVLREPNLDEVFLHLTGTALRD
jgi:ABC-type multidrug transport system ATPase subunit